jgi:uncharacterized protein YodC (DUF2158 family)
MKRKLGVVATAVLLGGFVSTNAFAAGRGGPTGGHAGVIAGGAGGVGVSTGSTRPFVTLTPGDGRMGAVAVGPGLGGVGLSAGSARPFITLTQGNGALAIGRGLGGVGVSAGSPSLTPGDRRLYSVPLSAGARFSPSNLYSTSLNSRQPAAPQANNSVAGGGTPVAQTRQPQNVSLLHAQDQSNQNRTNLEVGARVRLRSGGPMMAVLSVSGTEVTCVWFNAVGQAETGTFPAAGLM